MPLDGAKCRRGTLACLLTLLAVDAAFGAETRRPDPDQRDATRPPRAAVFRAPGFPTVDAPALVDATLDEALAGLPAEAIASPAQLAERLRRADFDVLVLPYGSAFPVEAWPAIRRFVRAGGGLVVLGGAPFHQPVRQEPGADGRFILLTRQPTFARELLIGPSDVVEADSFSPGARTVPVPGTGWSSAWPEAARAWALTVRLTRRRDMEREDGSSGPRDAVLRPLVHVLDAEGVPRLCPLLEIDRLRAEEAGARWVLAPTDARLPASVIAEAVRRALQGAVELVARPVRASVAPGDAAELRVAITRPAPLAGEQQPTKATVRVRNDSGREVFTGEAILQGTAEFRTGLVAVRTREPLPPGLYHAEVETPDAPWQPRSVTTGFWVRDEQLLARGPRLGVSRDWIRRDGRPFPVVGTTYMASDVHRKFLFEPNPHVWDRDFREMARRGVKLVRTGLWTAWSRAMLDPGALDEGVLAALEAYVLSAARHDVAVCFNFFAFLPPAYSGTNPYLDPRSLEGQSSFLALFAARFRGVPWIHWDLINEPSYAPPEGLWSNRPIGDEHERRAWAAWARAKHGDDIAALRDLWRDAGEDVLALPALTELNHAFLREDRRPRKARDFDEFSQEMVAGWAKRLRDVLRAAGGDVLVTLGQDEGGTADRSAQQLHADSVDYTAVHTWWNNDDLLWDGVMTKVPEKPNLHQETGLMSLHDVDGNPWRTPEAAARLLERKFAYAFAARGAGVVEWAWNVNPFMPVENEATIGFHRPDGTAKPELRVLSAFAAFFAEAGPWLDDFAPDPVVLVVPHSRLFAGRPRGLDATKRIVRALAERYGVVPTALSELRLTSDRLRGAKLVLVPVPEMLTEDAARALLEASRAGARVLVTGAVEGDPYGRATESLRLLGVLDAGRPVALREATRWGASAGEHFVTFEGLAQEWLRRSEKPEPAGLAGAVWHEPLPLELAQETGPLEALLGAALEAADVPTSPSDSRVAARVLDAPRASLVVCVNETPAPARRRVRVDGRVHEVPVDALRARLVLIERGTGRVVAATPGEPVIPAP